MQNDFSGTSVATRSIGMRDVLRVWWPLAASWMLMGAEVPTISAVVARLAQPEINLAAYGGVVFPLALLLEAPIIMLLAASTALSKDWASYKKLWRVMTIGCAVLTGLHLITAFTPFYYVMVETILGVPPEIVEPARLGLVIMTPWTWAIGYRRFNQGVLIRFGHSRAVGVGTVIRLTADVTVLAVGYVLGNVPGIVVATGAVTAGVVSEAIYTGWRVRPVLRYELRLAPPVDPPLTYRVFFPFYIPLMFTSFLSLVAQPIGSAALSRMPDALSSLAVWPVLSGLVFMFRGVGIAYNEVVVALLDKPRSSSKLWRFALLMAVVTSVALALIVATPLSTLWFERLSALSPKLSALAHVAIWFALPLPALSMLQSWYQGTILHSRHTRGISEAVVVYISSFIAILAFGVVWGDAVGACVGMAALTTSTCSQTFWLWRRSIPIRQAIREQDAGAGSPSLQAAS